MRRVRSWFAESASSSLAARDLPTTQKSQLMGIESSIQTRFIAWRKFRETSSSSALAFIGLEYASMFAALGVKVTLLDQRPILLDFVDREIVESLCFQLRQLGTVFRLGEEESFLWV